MCRAVWSPRSGGDLSARRRAYLFTANAGVGVKQPSGPGGLRRLPLPNDRIRQSGDELIPDAAHSRRDFTPEQQRLYDQGMRACARMIVAHVVDHPDEHARWMADDDDQPEAA